MTTETKTKIPPNEGKSIATRADIEVLGAIGASDQLPQAVFLPRSFAEVLEMAKLMANCAGAIRPHLRNKPGDCLAIIMQSLRWRMDPFAVANKTYFVNDQIAYEAQLVNAVVNQSGVLNGRLHIEWEGANETLHCRVTGFINGDDRPKVVTQAMAPIRVKNSPLWKDAPQQQLAYYTTRMWARLYVPEVLLGVYTPEDVAELVASKNQPVTILPPERPKRSDYEVFPTEPGNPAATAAEDPAGGVKVPEPEQPMAEAEAHSAAGKLTAWDVVDGDGELHESKTPTHAVAILRRLIHQCRATREIDGLVESNLHILGELPEDQEKIINDAITERQEALKKLGK